jgi:hypothetical protein
MGSSVIRFKNRGRLDFWTLGNETKPASDESLAVWSERRERFLAELIKDNDPLVYQQEYLAEFVDWAGVAFFGREKLLENGQPVPLQACASPDPGLGYCSNRRGPTGDLPADGL